MIVGDSFRIPFRYRAESPAHRLHVRSNRRAAQCGGDDKGVCHTDRARSYFGAADAGCLVLVAL